jgi:hypothetical protein
MIHGHAKVLDGQSTNDAARLGFAPWGSPSMTAFASESAEATAPLNVGEATLTMSRRDPPGSY